MKKLVFLLFAFAASLFPKTSADKTNVNVIDASRLFASGVSDIRQIDFANMRAFFFPSPGDDYSARQQLRRGKGGSIESRDPFAATDVNFVWQKSLDSNHMLVAYYWTWMAGSSSESEVIQVFEWRNGKVYIIQQIDSNMHGGYPWTDAVFDAKRQRLTVKSVELESPRGRCCPTLINIVVFQWNGTKFQKVSARQAPMLERKGHMRS